jgi:FkbM family methyltransferase
MNIFIDCGAWEGSSIKYWRSKHGKDWKIYAFECNPQVLPKLTKVKDVTFFESAVWTSDGRRGMLISDDRYSESATLFSKPNLGRFRKNQREIEVSTIDFASWLTRIIKKYDHPRIVCKMNIEGAEYEVLRKMYKAGILGYIEKLYVDWHWEKCGIKKSVHDSVIGLLDRSGIDYEPWKMRRINGKLFRGV